MDSVDMASVVDETVSMGYLGVEMVAAGIDTSEHVDQLQVLMHEGDVALA